MSILKEELKVNPSNFLTGYFPSRTNNKEGDFDWDIAQALLIRNLYLKTFKPLSKGVVGDEFSAFKRVCKEEFDDRLDEPGLWEYIERMYFDNGAYLDIAPEFMLFHLNKLTASAAKNRLGDMFISMLQGLSIAEPAKIQRNFLEQQVIDSFDVCLKDYDGNKKLGFKGNHETPYLPFLSSLFRKDVEFLSNHPKYLISSLRELLKLYGYLYTAQMALNIKGLPAEPESKPLYFIMESETASQERVDLKKNGHQKVAPLLANLFPYLSMSESLQQADDTTGIKRIPLWKLAQKLTDDDIPSLVKYAEEFSFLRFESESYVFPEKYKNDVISTLKELLRLSVKQFDKGYSRAAANGKFIKITEQELCSSFVKSRGKIGKVLVINQDYIMLLTNVAIGARDKLRFHELLDEFKERGVYFDKKSQQALIQFYERVGNVERMSDSGDAVYVRKTI